MPSEITSNTKSDLLLLIPELFKAIGQPRNYDVSAQDGQHQERRKDEKQMGKNGHENASPSLWEERQREEEKRRAEKSEEWVGSTAAHSLQNGLWYSQTGGGASRKKQVLVWLQEIPKRIHQMELPHRWND